MSDHDAVLDCLRSALEYAQAGLDSTVGVVDVEALPGVDVAELRVHVVEVLSVFAAAAGCAPGSFLEHGRCLLARALDTPQTSWQPWGSRHRALWTLVAELLVHTWDLDTAVGRRREAPAGCGDAAVACRLFVAEYRRLGTVGPERDAPDEADVVERLAALYGRDVRRGGG